MRFWSNPFFILLCCCLLIVLGCKGSAARSQEEQIKELARLVVSRSDHSGGGGTLRKADGTEDRDYSYSDIPAISEEFVRERGDKEKFLLLAFLLRDSDDSVHVAATKGLAKRFGYQSRLLPEIERSFAFTEAMEWWEANKDKLVWDGAETRFKVAE